MLHKEYGCGLEAALDVVGGKWKVLILWPLRVAPRRFGELRREVPGISEKMLIQHLKEMELDGIVTRKDYKEVPPRVEYALTEFGGSLCDALAPLCAWGSLHMKRIEACKATFEEQRQKIAPGRARRAEAPTDATPTDATPVDAAPEDQAVLA